MKRTLWTLAVLMLPLSTALGGEAPAPAAGPARSPEKVAPAPEIPLDPLFGAKMAEDDLGLCGPIPVGWTCSFSTECHTNLACTGQGSPGHVLVTACRCCPPCSSQPCDLTLCTSHSSVTCGC